MRNSGAAIVSILLSMLLKTTIAQLWKNRYQRIANTIVQLPRSGALFLCLDRGRINRASGS